MAISIPALGAVLAIGLALATCHRPAPKPAVVQQAQTQAATATAQAQDSRADAAAADHAAQKTIHIVITSQEAQRAVQASQGASMPVPADVLAHWSSGLQHADAAAGVDAGDDLGQRDQAVPAPK